MRHRRPLRDERGAAVVLGVALVGVLALVATVCVGTVALVLAHRRAQVVADLASLAGAGALQRGEDPCGAAGRLAGRQHTVVTDCVVEGTTVVVATAVALPAALGGGAMSGRARAGPVSGPVGGQSRK